VVKRLSEIERGAGYFMGVVTNLMDVVREKMVPFDAIYRLATPEGRTTIQNMVKLAHTDWLKEQPVKPLAKNEYLVPVTYAPLPSFVELEQEFGEGNVSCIFDGRPFTKHFSCSDIPETPSSKVFLVKHFDREINSNEAINEMDKLGYRPATHIEAYEFQKAHSDLRLQFRIVVLGSFAMVGGSQFVAVLRSDPGRRSFDFIWFDIRWHADNRFLFVRK